MLLEHAQEFARRLKLANPGERQGWFLSTCPMHPWDHSKAKGYREFDSNPPFGINLEEEYGYCFSCGFKAEGLHEIAQAIKLKHPDDYEDFYHKEAVASAIRYALTYETLPVRPKTVVIKEVTPWSPGILDHYPNAVDIPHCMEYLRKRGIPLRVIERCKLKFDPDRDNLVIPYFGRGGVFYGMRGRSLNPDAKIRFYEYRFMEEGEPFYPSPPNSDLYWLGEDSVPSVVHPVIVVEGTVDQLRMLGYTGSVVASQMGNPSLAKINRLKKLTSGPYLLLLDNDDTGVKGRNKLLKELGSHNCVWVEYPEGYGKDPGEWSDSQIRYLLDQLHRGI